MIQFKEMTVKDIKKILDTYPDDTTMLLLTLNFDKNEKVSNSGEFVNKEKISVIAEKAKTIIYHGDRYLTHVDMHSIKQDIYNIKSAGVMKTILLEGIKK